MYTVPYLNVRSRLLLVSTISCNLYAAAVSHKDCCKFCMSARERVIFHKVQLPPTLVLIFNMSIMTNQAFQEKDVVYLLKLNYEYSRLPQTWGPFINYICTKGGGSPGCKLVREGGRLGPLCVILNMVSFLEITIFMEIWSKTRGNPIKN